MTKTIFHVNIFLIFILTFFSTLQHNWGSIFLFLQYFQTIYHVYKSTFKSKKIKVTPTQFVLRVAFEFAWVLFKFLYVEMYQIRWQIKRTIELKAWNLKFEFFFRKFDYFFWDFSFGRFLVSSELDRSASESLSPSFCLLRRREMIVFVITTDEITFSNIFN